MAHSTYIINRYSIENHVANLHFCGEGKRKDIFKIREKKTINLTTFRRYFTSLSSQKSEMKTNLHYNEKTNMAANVYN